MKLGAQFYSIRTKTTTPEDLKASFKAMKEVGYENAQMSAICILSHTLTSTIFLLSVHTHRLTEL